MNCGDNLTLVGAIGRDGWLTLSTKWRAMTKERFIDWVRRGLARVCAGATWRYAALLAALLA